MELPLVSVICATYNHEKFIGNALNSILNQKTTFPFEVLIGEDCSTDNSRVILKLFEDRYPNFFKMYYREQNYGPEKNFSDLYSKAKGKYIIVLETDDFWIDEHKLQKEVEYLENNPEYIAVAHRCIIVDENNDPIGVKYPECTSDNYSFKDYMKDLFPGQTTSLMYKNFYLNSESYSTQLVTDNHYHIGPGDARKAFMLIANGKVGCIPEKMSAYRLITKGGSSYTANVKRDASQIIKQRKNVVNYAVECTNNSKAIFAAEYMLLRDLCIGMIKRNESCTFNYLKNEFKSMHRKLILIMKVLFYCVFAGLRKALKKNVTYQKSNLKREKEIMTKNSYIWQS